MFLLLTQRKASAWKGAVLVSLALIIWIGVEITMIGYHFEPSPSTYLWIGGNCLAYTYSITSYQIDFKIGKPIYSR